MSKQRDVFSAVAPTHLLEWSIALAGLLLLASTVAHAQTTGTCLILGSDQKQIDAQSCTVAQSDDETVYTWPKGTRTIVKRLAAGIELNGFPAVTVPGRKAANCLKSSKSGNTFCFNKTTDAAFKAHPKQVAAPSPATPAAATIRPAPTAAITAIPKNIPSTLTLSGHGDWVTSAAFSPDGTRIVTASRDSTARVWDSGSGALLATLSGHSNRVDGATFSPDGTRIVTASMDATARLWDAKTGTLLTTLTGHGDSVSRAVFSPDGTRILTACDDKAARIWDAKSGALLTTFTGHGSWVRSAAFSPDGSRIVTASGDKTARIWDARSGSLLTTFSGHGNWLLSAAFSPDGTRIVTASVDKTARIWDSRSGSLLVTLSGHGDYVKSAAFSPDGSRILTASDDRTARLWDSRSAMLLTTLSGHGGSVQSAAFSSDGNRIVTASEDKTAWLWDLDTGRKDRYAALARLDCRAVKALDAQIGGPGEHASCLEMRRTAAFRDLKCEEIGGLDKEIGGPPRESECRERAALVDERRAALKGGRCDQVEALDNRIGGERFSDDCRVERRKQALAALECDEVQRLDSLLKSGDQHGECTFRRISGSGDARDMYLAAVKLEADKDRARAKSLYLAIVERFPKDDLAIKAGERITALSDVEAVESSNAAASSAAVRAQHETQQAIKRANQEAADRQRAASESAIRDKQKFCEGRSSCIYACGPYKGTAFSACTDQCRSRFSICQ